MSIRANVDRTRLNERIIWQRKTETQDGTTGRFSTTWTTLIKSWAAVDGEKASNRYSEPHLSAGELSVFEYTIWVRSDIVIRYGLRKADRGLWRGRIFDIKDIPDQQLRSRLMCLICRAGENEG